MALPATVGTTPTTNKEVVQFQPKLGPVSGYRTFNEGESTLMKGWRTKLASIYEKFGYSPLENRPVERTENLLLKGGLNKEIYGLCRAQNGDQIDVALPFDRTVPFAIWVAENQNDLVFPLKRWDIDYSFRGEHAVANLNRFRGFIQADIDTIDYNMGSRIQADAECLATTVQALKSLEIPPFLMNVNHIRIARAIIRGVGVPEKDVQDVLQAIDKLDKKSPKEIAQLIYEIVPDLEEGQAELLISKFDFKGNIKDFVIEKEWGKEAEMALGELKALFEQLRELGVKDDEVIFNLGMVRGLDYYTGVVCETFFKDSKLQKNGSIASGGRYDKLVDTFANKETGLQGVGVSIGLTRLFGVLSGENLLDTKKKGNSQVFVGFRTGGELASAARAANMLREKGFNVDLYSGDKKIQKQLEYASKKGIPYSFLAMDDKSYVVKDMNNPNDSKGEDCDTIAKAVSTLIAKLLANKK